MDYSAGVIITYENNGVYDYQHLAENARSRVVEYLNLPCTLLPTKSSRAHFKEYDDGKRGSFLVSGRISALYDSPYRFSLLMDADFVVSTDLLALEMERFIGSGGAVRFLRNSNVVHKSLSPVVPRAWSTLFFYDRNSVDTRRFLDEAQRITAFWQMRSIQCAMAPASYSTHQVFSLAEDHVFGQGDSISPDYSCEYHRGYWRGRDAVDCHATHKTSLSLWYNGKSVA